MTSLDIGPQQAPETQQPAGPPPPPPLTSTDLSDISHAQGLQRDTQAAYDSGNTALGDELMGQQGQMVSESIARGSLEGSTYGTSPAVQFLSEDAQFAHTLQGMMQVEDQFGEALNSGGYYDLVQPLYDEVLTTYRDNAQNKELMKKWRDDLPDEEKIALMEKFQPVTIDPNRVAEARQLLAQIDASLPEGTSVFTHPKTREIAGWLNREASPQTPGFLQSGEQEAELGVAGTAAQAVLEFGVGTLDFGLNLAYGSAELADYYISGLTGGEQGQYWQRPTSVIRGPDGKVHTNAGRVSPALDFFSTTYALATGGDVEQVVADVNAAREWEMANRDGFQNILLGASHIAGMGVGFGLPGGAAMGVGARAGQSITQKGLNFLGTLGKSSKLKGAAALAANERAHKIVKLMGGVAGAGLANGLMEGVAYGDHEGYSKAFWHGAEMAPILMVLGALGKRTEALARKKMPKRVAEQVGAAVEGAGFGVLEINDMSPLWKFVQDPSQASWDEWAQIVAKNMIGIMAMKAGARTTPGREALEPGRAQAREQAARRVSEKGTLPKDREAVLREADAMGVSRETLTELGQVSREREALKGASPGEAKRLGDRQRELETELDRQEMGLGEPDVVRQEAARKKLKKAEEAQAAGDELEAEQFERVARGLKKVGQKLQTRGRLEQALERKGRVLPDPARMLGPGKDPISRLMKMQQRREGTKEITAATAMEVGMAVGPKGQVVMRGKKGEKGAAVDVDKLIDKLGADARETITVHTHPKPETFSVGDLAYYAHKARKGKESPPDFVVTSEGVWEARVGETHEPLIRGEAEKFNKERTAQWFKVRDLAAERLGEGALEAMRKFQRGERLTRSERTMAREMTRLKDEFMIASGKALGLEIRRVSPEQAMETLRKHQGKEAPRGDIETQTEISNREFPAAGGEEFVAERTTERVRASDIIREMEGQRATRGIRIPFTDKFLFSREGDPIQLPIRKKGFNKQGIRGYIDQRQDIVRSKEAYDLNNLAHEFAHHMEKKLTGRRWAPTGKALAEVLDIGEPMYQKSWHQPRKVAEGWAEFWARDLLGDKDLHGQYPTLSRELTQIMMQQPRIAEQYARLKDAYRIWREQGAGARAQQEIEGGPGAKPSKQEKRQRSVMDKVEEVSGRLVDDASQFKRSWAGWMKVAGIKTDDLPISMRPDKLSDLYKMKAAKRAEFLMNAEMTNFAGERTGKSLKESLDRFENVKELSRFWGYMKRQRELEMMDRGLETGVDRQEAMAAVSALETPKFREVAAEMQTWFHGLVDLVTEAGGLSVEQGQKVKRDKFYIPFHRMIEGPQGAGRTGVSRTSGGIKRMKGGTEPILDPREAIARMTTALVSRAQQAHVSKALYNNYVVLEGVGGLVTEVARDNVPSHHPLAQIARGLDKLARDVPGDKAQPLEGASDVLKDLAEGNWDALTLFSQAQLPKGSRPIVAFTPNHTEVELQRLVDHKRNSGASDIEIDRMMEKLHADQGKLKFLELDKDAYEALAGIENGSASYEWLAGLGSLRDPVEKAIRMPTQMLRYFATGISIPFAFRNMIRDAMAHQLYTRNGSWIPLAGFQQFFKGFGEAFRAQRKEFKGDLFTALGGQATTYLGIEIQGGTRAPRVKGDPMSLLEKLRYPFRKVEELIGMTEQALRRREFQLTRKEALDRGATDLEANLEALYDAQEVTTNFTRASSITRQINGVKAYFNAGVQGNRKFVRTVLGYEGGKAQDHAIKAGLANLTATSMLAYLWHGEEDWFKDLPEWRKTGYWNFRPLDDGPIVSIPKPHEPGLMFTLPMEKVLDELMDGNPVSTKTALLEVMGGFLNNYQVLPDIIAPAIEVTTNYSMFRKRPIVPHWMERSRAVEDQYTAYTTRAARWIGEAVGVSPAKAEHLISGYSGGGLLQLARAVESVAGVSTSGQQGFTGFGMLAQKPHKSSRAVDDLYSLRKEIEQASGSDRAGLGTMPTRMRAFRSRVGKAIDSIKDIQRRAREGKVNRDDANEQSFQIADRILNQYREN